MSMDPFRIVYIYVILTSIAVFFLYLGIKLLRRDPKYRLNQYKSSFYFCVCIGIIINIIYGLINDPSLSPLVSYLNVLSFFFVSYAMSFMLLFILMMSNPNYFHTTKSQLSFLLVYLALELVIFFIPNGATITITSDGVQSYPEWSAPFAFYLFFLLLGGSIISITLLVRLRNRFSNKILKQKMTYFIIGIAVFFYYGISICLSNFLDMYLFRVIYTITGFLVIPGAYFLYYGVGLGLNENFQFQ